MHTYRFYGYLYTN